uniref:Uncharacterized protein n=1 Tax=Candidatus Kentrum sp. TC TaxID=2126339 RepID=A0A450Z2V8_9GAMM|nr:MAG: hypothetical protein BECKTC1821E_GA0114239_11034 [Candidatus Kentron sp. TC]
MRLWIIQYDQAPRSPLPLRCLGYERAGLRTLTGKGYARRAAAYDPLLIPMRFAWKPIRHSIRTISEPHYFVGEPIPDNRGPPYDDRDFTHDAPGPIHETTRVLSVIIVIATHKPDEKTKWYAIRQKPPKYAFPG